MTRINIHISKAKLLFYPPCEVKYGLQNEVSTLLTWGMKKVAESEEIMLSISPFSQCWELLYSMPKRLKIFFMCIFL